MFRRRLVFVVSVLIVVCFHTVQSTHLRGSFRGNEFFKFIVKFGFQKTDRHQREITQGYIFGNVTSRQGFSVPVTLAVLDRTYFIDYYQNRLRHDKRQACKYMFSRLKVGAFHPKCSPKGHDYLRRIPCPKDQLCVDEDTPGNVVKGNQFTYLVQDLKQPRLARKIYTISERCTCPNSISSKTNSFRFWYLSMVACYINETTCEWHHYDPIWSYTIDYDIWLVNGSPNVSALSTLTYQFSFDRQNTLEMYMLFWLCYMVLVPLQLHAIKIQKHPVTKLFTASLLLDFLALCLILVHALKFSMDGVGYPKLSMAGDIFDILSRVRRIGVGCF